MPYGNFVIHGFSFKRHSNENPVGELYPTLNRHQNMHIISKIIRPWVERGKREKKAHSPLSA